MNNFSFEKLDTPRLTPRHMMLRENETEGMIAVTRAGDMNGVRRNLALIHIRSGHRFIDSPAGPSGLLGYELINRAINQSINQPPSFQTVPLLISTRWPAQPPSNGRQDAMRSSEQHTRRISPCGSTFILRTASRWAAETPGLRQQSRSTKLSSCK